MYERFGELARQVVTRASDETQGLERRLLTVVGRSLVVAVVAATSILAGTGCGGDDQSPRPSEMEGVRLTKEQYLARARAIQISAYSELTPVFTELVARRLSQQQCTLRVRFFHRRLERALKMVAELRPPAEVADLQVRFLAAAKESAKEVDEAVNDVERGRLSCGRALNDRIYGLGSTEEALRVLREFEQRGYKLVYD